MKSDDPMFSAERCQRAIGRVCDVMDDEKLGLFERWYVVHCIERAAAHMLGDNFREICEKYADQLGIDMPKDVD